MDSLTLPPMGKRPFNDDSFLIMDICGCACIPDNQHCNLIRHLSTVKDIILDVCTLKKGALPSCVVVVSATIMQVIILDVCTKGDLPLCVVVVSAKILQMSMDVYI